MQTKKRAKPVKFGDKEKVEKIVSSEEPVEAEQETEVVDVAEPANVEEEEVTPDLENNDTNVDLKESAEVAESEEEKDQEPEKPTEFFNLPPDKYENKKSIVPYFLLVTLVTFLLGLAFFYGVYYAVNSKARIQIPIPKLKETVTVTPKKEAPTPKPIDLSAFTISILNGTDVAGTAAKLKAQLEDAGFKVGSVGNADTTDFTKTEIASKKNVDKAYLEKLKEVVKKSYQIGATPTLSSGTADVVITIGSSSAK